MSVADQFGKIFARKRGRPAPGSAEIARARAGGFAVPRSAAPTTAAPAPEPVAHDEDGDAHGAPRFQASRLSEADDFIDTELVALPMLGRASINRHQRVLYGALTLSVLSLVLLAAHALRQANGNAQQLAATGRALMQSQDRKSVV